MPVQKKSGNLLKAPRMLGFWDLYIYTYSSRVNKKCILQLIVLCFYNRPIKVHFEEIQNQIYIREEPIWNYRLNEYIFEKMFMLFLLY